MNNSRATWLAVAVIVVVIGLAELGAYVAEILATVRH